jgi:hypothetical protein
MGRSLAGNAASVIHQPGIALLERWKILDAVVATGCPPIRDISYRVADVHLNGASEASSGQAVAYTPRRYLLDQVLVDAAVGAGVDFRDRAAVAGLLPYNRGVAASATRPPTASCTKSGAGWWSARTGCAPRSRAWRGLRWS